MTDFQTFKRYLATPHLILMALTSLYELRITSRTCILFVTALEINIFVVLQLKVHLILYLRFEA